MSSNELEINEVLCFMLNKIDKATINQVKIILANFYTEEELTVAKEILHGAACKLNVTDLPRLIKRKGDHKNRVLVDDLCELISFLDEKKCVSKLPIFVVRDTDRIPGINPENLDIFVMAQRMESIDARLMKLEAERSCATRVNASSSAGSITLSDRMVVCEDRSDDKVHVDEAPSISNDGGWTTVVKKKSPVYDQHYTRQGAVKSPLVKAKVSVKKIVGEGVSGTALKAATDIHRKFVVHVDNVDKALNCDDIKTFLSDNNISVDSCFSVKSWVHQADKESVVAFRVCVRLENRDAIMNEKLWPAGIIIRQWVFKNKNESSDA